ncbi:hypothetical protein [Polaromonas sp.]|uniref:hypothetical protein n=1 Tax=Polaromonas sp. TaxID=1869339 RepID=UPI001D1CB3C0|nr:hypothetical protein [Polaromonas sp.]MBT9476713.1 hypothetical protein [Polaromonas sp.]
MKTLPAIVLIAACAINTGASGQNSTETQPACPAVAEISPQHLYGSWRAELDGQPEGATLLLEKHSELAGSVSGRVTRASVSAQLAGDVDAGEFTLEESIDGEHISATWLGSVVASSCGQEIRGRWGQAASAHNTPFVLRKLPGW